jgi:putative spermidine/putrescine transport system permease protein
MNTRASIPLRAAALGAIVFLHVPILLIFLYAFTIEENAFTFPPPGLTTRWFGEIAGRGDFWQALGLSLQVAAVATLIAIVLGTMIALATYRRSFFGRDAINLLVVLPIALPGIVTGIALRSSISLLDVDFTVWTIIIGHATFCIVTVYNNVIARLRR